MLPFIVYSFCFSRLTENSPIPYGNEEPGIHNRNGNIAVNRITMCACRSARVTFQNVCAGNGSLSSTPSHSLTRLLRGSVVLTEDWGSATLKFYKREMLCLVEGTECPDRSRKILDGGENRKGTSKDWKISWFLFSSMFSKSHLELLPVLVSHCL